MSVRMNDLVNKENYIWFLRTMEELANVQIIFDSFHQDFNEIKRMSKDVLSKEKQILNFSWPNDNAFNKWMVEYHSPPSILQVTSEKE